VEIISLDGQVGGSIAGGGHFFFTGAESKPAFSSRAADSGAGGCNKNTINK
jgi:hypothetical protein